jgi:hypothetical protein
LPPATCPHHTHPQELGLPGSYADGTTAAALNSDALQAALAATPQAAAQRYRAAGWQLAVGPDMATPDYNAEKFIRQGALKFTVQPGAGAGGAHAAAGGGGGPGQVVVQAPVLTSRSVGEVRAAAAAAAAAPAGGGGDAASAAMAAAARDPYMVRFLGNWYTKVGRFLCFASVCCSIGARWWLRARGVSTGRAGSLWLGCARTPHTLHALPACALPLLPPAGVGLPTVTRPHACRCHAAVARARAPTRARALRHTHTHTHTCAHTQVLSVAQAMEWVMLDSLRQDVTWGGGDAAGSA